MMLPLKGLKKTLQRLSRNILKEFFQLLIKVFMKFLIYFLAPKHKLIEKFF